MKKRPRGILAVVCVAAPLGLAGWNATAGDRLHGEPPETGHALSHDGSKMIVLRESGRGRYYDVIDTNSGESRGLLERSFLEMRWGDDSDTAYATASGGRIYRIALDTDSAEIAHIALTGAEGIPPAETPGVLTFPVPAYPVLLARGSRGDRPLYRCTLDPARGEAEIAARCEIADPVGRRTFQWLVAPGGRIAARIVLAPSGEREFQARTGEGDWRPVFRFTNHYTELTTIGGVQNDNTVWALSNRNRESVALVRLDVTTGEEVVVHQRRRVDVDRAFALFDGAGGSVPLLASHFHGYQEVVHFDARLEAAYAALGERVGAPVRIDFKSADRALNFAVVEVRSPEIYKRRYLLDLEARTSRILSAGTLAVHDRPAAPSRPVSFAASDGLALHGYLTLPDDAAETDPPPMVLWLHGGPWKRERWPAPPLFRYLGSRGYAVLRLNYRGSVGYGRRFLEAGRGALFGRLPQDVLDAARWAVAEGYAAEGRIALLGGSFGGFLALAALSRYPDAFGAAVAFNAATDAVAFWKRDWSRAGGRVIWREFLASRDLPKAALARISPLNNVHKIDAPVLLLAGTRDRRVPPEHSFELFDLLRAAGKPAELVEYQGAGHDLWGHGANTREHLSGRLGEFLARHLPVEQR